MTRLNHLGLALLMAGTLAACGNEAPTDRAAEPGEPGTNAGPPALPGPAEPPGEAPADTQRVLPRIASPARIAEIAASGRTGLWAEPAGLCPGRTRDAVVLAWNVEDTGADQVVVVVVGDNGQEKPFGRGGPVGERQSGPWAKAGMEFRVREAQGEQLASVVIDALECAGAG